VLRATGLALAFLLASASAAVAADDASIAHVETSRKGLQILVSVPPDATVDLTGVSVTVERHDAPARAVLATSTTEVRRTAVLAIDTSNSMRGQRFDAAKAAALAFLDAVPADVYVGIVSFAGDVVEPLDPTLDRDRARAVVSSLDLSEQTRLYDGVLAAVAMAGTEGQRTLLVLSDGADTTRTDIGDVTAAITDAGVLVDVVSLEQSGAAVTSLRDLADAGEGRVISADSAALSRAFSREAGVLARQILITAQVPDSVTSTEATLAVELPSDRGPLSAQVFTTVRGAAATPPGSPAGLVPDRGWSLPAGAMYGGVAALGLGLIVLLVLLVPASSSAPMTAQARISTYTAKLENRPSGGPRLDTDQALTQATGAAAQVLSHNRSLEDRIFRRLEGAGSSLKPAEWLLLHAAIFVGAGIVGLLLGTGSVLIGLVFLAFGALGPWLYLGIRRSRRRKAFSSSLPDTLQLMSGALAAGLSLAQSVDTIVREGVEPISSEFKRVLAEARLGVALEEAMEGVADRFESKDFAWVVMAIKIQRQVGGNLAELLASVAATMREREYMRRQVAALAAEGKLSAWVLGGLPPAFLLYLLVGNREYVMPMFTEPIGWLMLGGAALLLSIGAFWMSRLIKVEV
jgi:tight adherence protein B